MNGVKTARARSTVASGASTPTRIVDAALALFNAHGVRHVTTNHIADHLGISPGNLYYHFRNKEEIVRAILPRIDGAVHAAVGHASDDPITAEELGAYYLAGVENLSAYRFYFADVSYLVSRDPAVARSYRALHDWLVATFVRLFRILQRDGRMDRTLGDDDLTRVAVNAFIIWWSWLGYVRTAKPDVTLDREASASGALQSFLILAPYLEPRFCTRARAVLERGAGLRAPGGTRARRRPVASAIRRR